MLHHKQCVSIKCTSYFTYTTADRFITSRGITPVIFPALVESCLYSLIRVCERACARACVGMCVHQTDKPSCICSYFLRFVRLRRWAEGWGFSVTQFPENKFHVCLSRWWKINTRAHCNCEFIWKGKVFTPNELSFCSCPSSPAICSIRSALDSNEYFIMAVITGGQG